MYNCTSNYQSICIDLNLNVHVYWKCFYPQVFLFTEYFHSKGVTDPHNYFSREMSTSLVGSTPHLSELMAKSHTWLDSWSVDYLKSKGVKIPSRQTDKRKLTLRSTKSQPIMKLPHCDPIEVINHFVRTEHERELARSVDIINIKWTHTCTCTYSIQSNLRTKDTLRPFKTLWRGCPLLGGSK